MLVRLIGKQNTFDIDNLKSSHCNSGLFIINLNLAMRDQHNWLIRCRVVQRATLPPLNKRGAR